MKIDRDLLHLHDIVDAGEAIISFTREGREAFLENRMARDAVIRNLTVIGEATKRLSPAIREQHPHVPWRDIAGLRDIVITATSGSTTKKCGASWRTTSNVCWTTSAPS